MRSGQADPVARSQNEVTLDSVILSKVRDYLAKEEGE